jgi:rRNA maturation RNase YbeY
LDPSTSNPEPDPAKTSKAPAAPSVVIELAELPRYAVDEAKLAAVAGKILAALGVADHELSLSIVDSDAIQDINREFRGKDRPTDVLSFPQQEFSPPLSALGLAPRTAGKGARKRGPQPMLGDVVISLPEAEANARGIGQALDREVAFLLVHGILHLCGHDHEAPEEEQRMLAEQRALMDVLTGAGDSDAGAPAWTACVVAAAREGGA